MTEQTMQRAICSAAIYMGDPDLEDTGISVITRIIYASKDRIQMGNGLLHGPRWVRDQHRYHPNAASRA